MTWPLWVWIHRMLKNISQNPTYCFQISPLVKSTVRNPNNLDSYHKLQVKEANPPSTYFLFNKRLKHLITCQNTYYWMFFLNSYLWLLNFSQPTASHGELVRHKQTVTMYYLMSTTQMEGTLSLLAKLFILCCNSRTRTHTPLVGTCTVIYTTLCSQYANEIEVLSLHWRTWMRTRACLHFYSYFLLSFVSWLPSACPQKKPTNCHDQLHFQLHSCRDWGGSSL